MLGSGQVGKSSLCAQFMSSDHVNTYLKVGKKYCPISQSYSLFAEDDVCKEVSVSIDGEETRLIFVDHQHGEMSVENQLSTYNPDAFLIVFAVDDEASLVTNVFLIDDIIAKLENIKEENFKLITKQVLSLHSIQMDHIQVVH